VIGIFIHFPVIKFHNTFLVNFPTRRKEVRATPSQKVLVLYQSFSVCFDLISTLLPSNVPMSHGSQVVGSENDTSVQQTVSFRCRVNKRFVFGGASTNGSFSEARQQTVRFRRRVNKLLVFGGASTNG